MSQQWISFVHPDDVEETNAAAANIRSGPLYNFTNRYRTKYGDYITLSWNARQINDGTIFACARVINNACHHCPKI